MEVDHRAMNALALVQSIVSLTRSDTDEGLLHAIRRRVNALANAHRLLSSHHWRGVGLHDLVRTQTGEAAIDRVVLDGSPVQLATHAVQPLALVLHELFSNAQTHGALSGEQGSVQLSWGSLGTSLQMCWQEYEVVYEEPAVTNKVGLAIVRNVVESQLNGRMTRTVQNAALVVTVDLPDAVNFEVG
jgi:two-component sensor histidine kinase